MNAASISDHRFRVIAITVVLASWLPSTDASEQTQPPNFVVILTDDQSWVGSSLVIDPDIPQSRSDYFRTPNIERLAALGMQFSQAYAPAPFCCPTRRSLTIGQTPARHIYQKNQPTWAKQYRQQLSLPKMLKAANARYRTAHFGKWDARFDSVTPEEMGYDISDGLTGNSTGGGKGSGGPAASEDPKLIFDLTRRAGEFIERESAAGNPFFVQVSHYAVHLDIFYRQSSFDSAANWKQGEKHTMPAFAAMTSDVDEGIGQLVDKIHSLGLKDRTYLFFLSDNGGRFEMPAQKGKTLDRNHPLRDGKGSMYEGGIRVPFIVCGPDVEPGTRSRVAVTGLDIFPTIAELAGYKQLLPKSLDGGSLTNVLRAKGIGKVKRTNPFLLFHQAVARKAQTAMILGDFKLVKTWEENRIELFNLAADIGEQNDLSDRLPKKRDDMHRQMVKFLDDVGAETRKSMTKEAQKKLFESALNELTPSVHQETSPIAFGGGLKMFYDNRAYPMAVTLDDAMHFVWRGVQGFPYLATYDVKTGYRSKPQMLLDGYMDEIKPDKYRRDHHFAPVIWSDSRKHLHVLFGCHKTPGIHLISRAPNSTEGWERGQSPWESISYPKIHGIAEDKTLIYYRHAGHLGDWQYQISSDGGRSWDAPVRTVDFDAMPQDSEHASYAGSYNTTAVSDDGKRLHVGLIWKVEEPLPNRRYGKLLGDHTQRYNLYYLSVDLKTGRAHDVRGGEVELPIRKRIAEEQCLVWNTDERVAAVGPSIALDENDRPHFLLPISGETPLESTFYHVTFDPSNLGVRSKSDHREWRKTPITSTLHPFNAGHLEYSGNGTLKAYLIAGSGVDVVEEGMDEYGWGQRVELWESPDAGKSWTRERNLSSSLEDQKFQNVQFIADDRLSAMRDRVLFYGWSERDGTGTAYLWKGQE